MTMKVVSPGCVSIGEGLIINFCFANDIVVNAEEEEKADVPVDGLDATIIKYKPDTTRVTTYNANGFQREIKIKGQRFEAVENFKFLESIISDLGSKPDSQDCPDNSSCFETEDHMDVQDYIANG